jgi:hypothetical protein
VSSAVAGPDERHDDQSCNLQRPPAPQRGVVTVAHTPRRRERVAFYCVLALAYYIVVELDDSANCTIPH